MEIFSVDACGKILVVAFSIKYNNGMLNHTSKIPLVSFVFNRIAVIIINKLNEISSIFNSWFLVLFCGGLRTEFFFISVW